MKPLLTISRLLGAAVENGLREKYEATSDYELQTCAWRILEDYSLPVGAVVTGIEHTDNAPASAKTSSAQPSQPSERASCAFLHHMKTILTARAQREIRDYKLADSPAYQGHFTRYAESYERRGPANTVPTRNLLKALRFMTWLNTPDDWARLHATEAFLRNRH